jgi:hypothetical protein
LKIPPSSVWDFWDKTTINHPLHAMRVKRLPFTRRLLAGFLKGKKANGFVMTMHQWDNKPFHPDWQQ